MNEKMEPEITDKLIEIIKITEGNICNRCLGRNFSKVLEADGNLERGKYLRQMLSSITEGGNDPSTTEPCYVCNDILKELDKPNNIVDRIVKKINESGIEFSNFLVGCRVDPEILEREKDLQGRINVDVESIKKEINREVGKAMELKLDQEVEFDNPNLVVTVNLKNGRIEFQTNPIFIEGRYRKLLRGIPQTKWPCIKCRGKGCERCNFTGKMYQESVEELISPEALKVAQGRASKFHGAGREDIDVRMLGRGRPFVLEIKEPKIRRFNLEELKDSINLYAEGKVEVLDLKFVGKERRSQIKTSSTDTYKVYRAVAELEEEVEDEVLESLKSLKVIKQRTPIRVSHRRADKIRTREVRNLEFKRIGERMLELVIQCEGGLYIKELISGDQMRTKPSVSQILGTPSKCVKLDVLEVNI
jgi:tRNA pseudouridine synthase 10